MILADYYLKRKIFIMSFSTITSKMSTNSKRKRVQIVEEEEPEILSMDNDCDEVDEEEPVIQKKTTKKVSKNEEVYEEEPVVQKKIKYIPQESQNDEDAEEEDEEIMEPNKKEDRQNYRISNSVPGFGSKTVECYEINDITHYKVGDKVYQHMIKNGELRYLDLETRSLKKVKDTSKIEELDIEKHHNSFFMKLIDGSNLKTLITSNKIGDARMYIYVNSDGMEFFIEHDPHTTPSAKKSKSKKQCDNKFYTSIKCPEDSHEFTFAGVNINDLECTDNSVIIYMDVGDFAKKIESVLKNYEISIMKTKGDKKLDIITRKPGESPSCGVISSGTVINMMPNTRKEYMSRKTDSETYCFNSETIAHACSQVEKSKQDVHLHFFKHDTGNKSCVLMITINKDGEIENSAIARCDGEPITREDQKIYEKQALQSENGHIVTTGILKAMCKISKASKSILKIHVRSNGFQYEITCNTYKYLSYVSTT